MLLLLWSGELATIGAESVPLEKAEFARQAERAYQAAKARFGADPDSPEADWQFGRACYDWADYAKSKSRRAEIAQEGIAACRHLIERRPESAWGHYYLAMDMGQLAQTKKLGALRLVRQMEGEFTIVLGLDQKLDFAGPDRNLGLLYLEAPGWPTSIGSKAKARQHLEKAAAMSPDYPENLLNLAEAEMRWGEKNAALRELATLVGLWPAAREKFKGAEWGSSWADWEKRRQSLETKKTSGARRVIEPPRKFDGE